MSRGRGLRSTGTAKLKPLSLSHASRPGGGPDNFERHQVESPPLITASDVIYVPAKSSFLVGDHQHHKLNGIDGTNGNIGTVHKEKARPLVELDKVKPQFHPDRLTMKYSLNFACPSAIMETHKQLVSSVEHRTNTKITVSRGSGGDTDISSVSIWGSALNDIKTAAKTLNEEVGMGWSPVPASAPPSLMGDENPFTFSEPVLSQQLHDHVRLDERPPVARPRSRPHSRHSPSPTADVAETAEPVVMRRRPTPTPLSTDNDLPTVRLGRRDLAPPHTSSKMVQTDQNEHVVLSLDCDGVTGDVIVSGDKDLLQIIQRKLSRFLRSAEPRPDCLARTYEPESLLQIARQKASYEIPDTWPDLHNQYPDICLLKIEPNAVDYRLDAFEYWRETGGPWQREKKEFTERIPYHRSQSAPYATIRPPLSPFNECRTDNCSDVDFL